MGEGWSFLNSKQGYHGMAYCRKDTVQVLHEISFNVLFMVFVIWDTLRDLVPFVQYKNVIDTISKVESCNLTKSSTPLWGFFFHVFKILQMVPTCAKHVLTKHLTAFLVWVASSVQLLCWSYDVMMGVF